MKPTKLYYIELYAYYPTGFLKKKEKTRRKTEMRYTKQRKNL